MKIARLGYNTPADIRDPVKSISSTGLVAQITLVEQRPGVWSEESVVVFRACLVKDARECRADHRLLDVSQVCSFSAESGVHPRVRQNIPRFLTSQFLYLT